MNVQNAAAVAPFLHGPSRPLSLGPIAPADIRLLTLLAFLRDVGSFDVLGAGRGEIVPEQIGKLIGGGEVREGRRGRSLAAEMHPETAGEGGADREVRFLPVLLLIVRDGDERLRGVGLELPGRQDVSLPVAEAAFQEQPPDEFALRPAHAPAAAAVVGPGDGPARGRGREQIGLL